MHAMMATTKKGLGDDRPFLDRRADGVKKLHEHQHKQQAVDDVENRGGAAATDDAREQKNDRLDQRHNRRDRKQCCDSEIDTSLGEADRFRTRQNLIVAWHQQNPPP